MYRWLPLVVMTFSAVWCQGLEWPKGVLLPDSKPVIKTTAQLMEHSKARKGAQKPKVPHPLAFAKLHKNFPNFTAMSYEDSGVIPPNAMGVVGPAQFIFSANGRVRSFEKATGNPDGILDISTSDFFNPVGKESFTTDSRIRYDHFSNRWVIIILATSLNPWRVMLAVSEEGIITPETKWSLFFMEPRHDGNPDYPTLGVDKNGLYIGVNIMGKEGRHGYFTSDCLVIPKGPLLKGELKAYTFKNVVEPKEFDGPTTPQGVDNFDSDPPYGYFLGIDNDGQNLQLRFVKYADGVPELSGNIPIPIPDSEDPLKVPQMGSLESKKFFLQGFDKRLCSPHIRNKRLYTAHNVGVDNLGRDVGITPTRNGCKWYEIDMENPEKPKLLQSGILFQPSKENDLNERYYWTPGLMTNGLQSLMVCCSTAGNRHYADAAYALRYSNDPPGTLREPVLFTKSNVVYTLGYPPFDYLRWGEYFHVSVDPVDNMTFWDAAEFSLSSVSWGLQVIRVPAAPPAKIIKLEPSEIDPNGKNIPMKIIGERVDGSAFYDPGEGYAKRLKVEIDGLAIESVKWIDATHIDLVVSNLEASPGTRKSVVITNPDGQKVEAKELLKINQD